jgi:hypothetical protein
MEREYCTDYYKENRIRILQTHKEKYKTNDDYRKKCIDKATERYYNKLR